MNRLQKIFSDNWAIRHHDLGSVVGLLMPSIIAGNYEGISSRLSAIQCEAKAYNPYLASWYEAKDHELPDGSVLVLRLRGTLYSWESEWLIDMINQAERNDRIAGIVFDIDGPGGMVSHLEQVAKTIKNCSKPTATVVTGMMASAHFWIGTSASRTFIASDTCEVGSVGAMVTHLSFREYFKKNGIDYREIYPDSSDLKNEEARALLDNDDESLIKEKAARLCLIFCKSVAENLAIEHNPELPLFRGRMFQAAEAVQNGYIDQYGDVDEAARWVLGRAVSQKVNSIIEK